MPLNEAFAVTEFEANNDKIENSIQRSGDNDKIYTYDEAIDLAGNGCYVIGLGLTLSLSLLGMSLDMFGFSTVVPLAACTFDLTINQTSILLSMPFIGAIFMSYAWGYVSDTRGRLTSLLISMFGSFTFSIIGAFSTNWIFMGICKLISCCLSSAAQSVAFALLGESCPERVKGTALFIMSSSLYLALSGYFVPSYFISNLNFSYDLGLITFEPWRLLALVLALPLGICSLLLTFFYESPKFLLNAGREQKALELLRKICKRNGRDAETYPVKRLLLNETGNDWQEHVSFLESLKNQTFPLFRPPLLSHTLKLYFLIAVVYGTNNGLFVWLPYLAETMQIGTGDQDLVLCQMITQSSNSSRKSDVACVKEVVTVPLLVSTTIMSLTFVVLALIMSKLAKRKKMLTIVILTISSASCIGTLFIPNNLVNFILFFSINCQGLSMGVLYAYFVDLFPTSVRGMSSCLGVMVARLSSITSINLVGPYVIKQCQGTFYCITGLILAGLFVSCLLPPDRKKKI